MITGIGIDIIELKRMDKSVQRQQRFPKRVLTESELDDYHRLTSARRQIEFIAGRFAAKEAFAKATGQGIGELSFQHIEVIRLDTGAPIMKVTGYEDYHIHLSISHSQEYVVAQVVLEQR